MNREKKKKEKTIEFSMWERYKINERIKIGYEKYIEKKVINIPTNNEIDLNRNM
tara:strand:- start:181 stop:342 length:162 start_codon:yes stop_codon:yes gene_type:complete